jgi:hypothetical protein
MAQTFEIGITNIKFRQSVRSSYLIEFNPLVSLIAQVQLQKDKLDMIK